MGVAQSIDVMLERTEFSCYRLTLATVMLTVFQALDMKTAQLNEKQMSGLALQAKKGSNERLFILTRTHSMQIFGETPFIKPKNDS